MNLVRLSSSTISSAQAKLKPMDTAESTPQEQEQENVPEVNPQSGNNLPKSTPQLLPKSTPQLLPKSTTVKDVCEENPEEDITVTDVFNPDLSVVKQIPAKNPSQNVTLWVPASEQQGSGFVPINLQPLESTPSQAALQLVDQVQPPLQQEQDFVQPQAQALPQTAVQTSQLSTTDQSSRWGKVLKGKHSFLCARCHAPFTMKSDTLRHYESNCPKLPADMRKKYICADCGEGSFTTKQYLREHIYKEHKKEFLYFCKSCNKGFYKHSNLNFHKKSCLAYLRS